MRVAGARLQERGVREGAGVSSVRDGNRGRELGRVPLGDHGVVLRRRRDSGEGLRLGGVQAEVGRGGRGVVGGGGAGARGDRGRLWDGNGGR